MNGHQLLTPRARRPEVGPQLDQAACASCVIRGFQSLEALEVSLNKSMPCAHLPSAPLPQTICLIIHPFIIITIIVIIILIILHVKGARVPSAPSTCRGGLPCGQEEKPVHTHSKFPGLDDFGIQNFVQPFGSDKCKYCIIPSRKISHNKTIFLQQISTLKNMMMVINSFNVHSGQFQSPGYENIFGFHSTGTLEMRICISPTRGK